MGESWWQCSARDWVADWNVASWRNKDEFVGAPARSSVRPGKDWLKRVRVSDANHSLFLF